MAKPTLLPDPTCLHLKLLDASETTITAVVPTTSEAAECPLCRRRSARIHSRYVRSVADLPWMGCAVRLELQVRCFFCPNPKCVRQIFTERLPFRQTGALDEGRPTIHNDHLTGAKSFAHQIEVGLRQIVRLPRTSNRQCLSDTR
jgi:transposase